MNKQPRETALKVLMNIEKNEQFSHLALSRQLEKDQSMEPLNKRFITHLVLGVLEQKLLLDYYIRKLSKQRFSRIDTRVVMILRMGFYQLVFMDKVPDSAAVNESVALAKKIGTSQASFVNGILRGFLRSNKEIPLPDFKQQPIVHLSIKYSHPEWLVKFWIECYGIDFAEKLMQANNMTPPLSIRVNALKTNKAALVSAFSKEGIEALEHPLCKDALVLNDMMQTSIERLPGYREGHFLIQDIASMCVFNRAKIKSGMSVLDVCAAPGGKSTYAAELLGNNGLVLSRDIGEEKLKLVKENAEKLGIEILKTECQDATEFTPHLANQMDLVLVDAPCSGLGIIRRKPDIKYKKSLDDLEALSLLQKGILETSSGYVKTGGQLIYSTCTLNPKENEQVIHSFLASHSEFELEPEGMITLFPNVDQTDGFFIATLVKVK